jgi:uncharacterized protein YjbI with pentapeptide repeats
VTGANLFEAVIKDADFTGTTSHGFTKEQLYSTASYAQKDLRGIRVSNNDLSNWNFVGQNLTSADLSFTTMTGANLSDAIIKGARFEFEYDSSHGFTKEQLYSTASYAQKDLTGIGLSGTRLIAWNFAGQTLCNANFASSNLYYAYLSNADLSYANLSSAAMPAVKLSGAIVKGANFGNTTSKGFMKELLYTTASYTQKDLAGIGLSNNDLSNWNFAGQNLTNANYQSATLTNTDFSLADLRGAMFSNVTGTSIMRNTIGSNGTIFGLSLLAGDCLVVRDFPMAITVMTAMNMADSSVLKLILGDNLWESLINLDTAVVPQLGGTLELAFAEDADLATLVGTEFKLFNWNGQLAPGSQFAGITTIPGAQWDLSHLYTDGTISLATIPEPATLSLLGLGFLALRKRGVRARRRLWQE